VTAAAPASASAASPSAASAASATLHARTVPLDYGPDALEFDGSPTVLFDRPGLTLVGWGTALLVPATGAAAALSAIPCEDEVGTLGSGPVALGALPFHDTFAGHLVVPRFTMGTSRDADGVTRRWATAVGPADVALPTTGELFDAVIWQYGTTPATQDTAVAEAVLADLSTLMSAAGYAAMVKDAVALMAEPRSTLRKVVLSRPIEVRLRGQLALSAVLRRLRAGEPNCTIFSMPVPDGSFFGASPELLVARHGSRVSSHPLAGTVPRGETARADADAQRGLAGSAKNRAEHRYVVEAIAAALAPFCAELSVPPEPSVVAFRSVAHLGTRIEGQLTGTEDEPTGVLELLRQLHPTPAVGGTPRAEALAFIAAHEAGERGHWAGPVGWVGADGDGEWMIGIRSAQLDPEEAMLRLRAGGGIVADSDPEAEAAEADVKLATVLDAVLPGASVQLR
jgi:menaquinone-specific isochorismate synthase